MKKTTVTCDVCKRNSAILEDLFVPNGKTLVCPASGNTEDDGINLDICGECAAEMLRLLMYNSHYDKKEIQSRLLAAKGCKLLGGRK